jgi:paraquat-inducible protein A
VATHQSSIGVTARDLGLASCHSCGAVYSLSEPRCERCGAALHSRKPLSLQRTWAYLLVGIFAYIPANALPIMNTKWLGGSSSDTIMSGVMALADSGSLFVALVVFVASVCIPVLKFIIILWLTLSLQFGWQWSEKQTHRLHVLIELIGRWSMIDVFVVAVLAALIQLGVFLSITPGSGIVAFALSVVFTMLAATAIDPRLLWDAKRHDA